MRRRRFGMGDAETDEAGGSHDRPWVFFMVDCFFLITEFFVLTFKFKMDEPVLPQTLPVGRGGGPCADAVEPLPVHVMQNGPRATYRCMSRELSISELTDVMAELQSSGRRNRVKVSYQSTVAWGDVMAVFNACSKTRIGSCGLVPLREVDAAPPGR